MKNPSILRATALRSGAALLGAASAFATAAAGEPANIEEIVVTASPLERPRQETILGVSVIEGEALERQLENTLGELLRRQPGVSSTFFGPGASRPVIRGLGGDRIRVLDSGVGAIDASATSPDHAVAVEPATAERVEILRGPATLLYGSSAAGGVVNVFSGRIPRAAPEDGASGALRIGGSTVDEGVEAAGGGNVVLTRPGDAALVLHLEGSYRTAEDYNIPGFAESARLRALEAEEAEGGDEEGEEEAFGVVENTALTSVGGSAGLSLVFPNGFVGVSGTAFDTEYGVPGAHGHEEEEGEAEEEVEEEGGVTIDLRQRRLDFDGEVATDLILFQKAKFRLGLADYEHAEIEPSGEVGTVFANEGLEGRFELIAKTRSFLGAELNGAVGVQYLTRDFSAIGEEAFVPPTETDQFGVFALKELRRGPVKFELGARYETTSHEVVETGIRREFDAVSVSGGVGVEAAAGLFFGVSGYRTERAPSTEELFSNGPHLATGAFELGDPSLGEETARGVEATARYANQRFSVALNAFYTDYDDFIFEASTGAEEDGLPVFAFMAEDARFYGFEAEGEVELASLGGVDLHLDASVDYVRAETTGDGANGNLPRIPPLSGLVGLEARTPAADLRAEVDLAARQDDVTDFELPTDGYAIVNLSATLRPFRQAEGLSVQLSARNVTDEEARLHTSFLKDIAPLPGRNFRVALRGEF